MPRPFRLTAPALACAILMPVVSVSALAAPTLNSKAWTYTHDPAHGYLSEIVSFDSSSQTLWVAGVSGVDVLNARTGALVQRIDTRAYGSINSVAIHGGIAAMAFEAPVRTDPGNVRLFDTATRSLLAGTNTFAVGALPDMLTFTPDGSKILVANEGTPSTYGAITSAPGAFPRTYGAAALDPAGSVSIIDLATRSVSATATLTGVASTGTHIRSNTGMDFEPEYIAVNAAGTKAYVSLQEANAMGVLDIQNGSFERIVGLGVKDFSLPGNRIDPLNDGNASLISVNAKGLYQPDALATFERGGQTFVVMANEGDFREDDGDRSRAGSAGLNAATPLDELRVSNTDSSAGNLFTAGARSFSIRDANGVLVYDSGEILDREAIAAGIYDDARSRDKGVEPEGVELMEIDGRVFAFIGLERTLQAAIAAFDITDPAHSTFIGLMIANGDRAPEGLEGYVLDGQYYLAFSNEGSSTTSVFRLSAVPEPGSLALAGLALFAVVGTRVQRARRGLS
ncbi:MAG: choice-of-anchor I family protein [Accumulibacter sp.]|jgi:DNA-binding beta-propeller fold protein YncE|uniref:choice-of-anchor I family protein n=1 Tax=Accumulibacter sp. TaxID=2053492 RepID=UPI002FC3AC13